MKYIATPHCMTTEFFQANTGWGDHGEMADYEPRLTVQVEADSPTSAASQIFTQFQNLDDDHLTPDDGRSLMVGDLVMLQEPYGSKVHWLKIEPIGFKIIERPQGEY